MSVRTQAGAAVGLGHRGGHVEHGTDGGLVPAVPLRHRDLEQAAVGEGPDALRHYPPVGTSPAQNLAHLPERSVATQLSQRPLTA
jgi:hypothetical protein